MDPKVKSVLEGAVIAFGAAFLVALGPLIGDGLTKADMGIALGAGVASAGVYARGLFTSNPFASKATPENEL